MIKAKYISGFLIILTIVVSMILFFTTNWKGKNVEQSGIDATSAVKITVTALKDTYKNKDFDTMTFKVADKGNAWFVENVIDRHPAPNVVIKDGGFTVSIRKSDGAVLEINVDG